MNLLIISACSAAKKYDPVIDAETIDQTPRKELIDQYPESVALAAEMYTGREHGHVRKAVSHLREIADVDWFIISAGFGLVNSDEPIPAYDCTFNEPEDVRERLRRIGCDPEQMTRNEAIKTLGDKLEISRSIQNQLTNDYDLLFIVLGETYLLTVEGALSDLPDSTVGLAFAAEGTKDHIGCCEWIPSTEKEREILRVTKMELKGKQLLTLAESIDNEEDLVEIRNNPDKAYKRSISDNL